MFGTFALGAPDVPSTHAVKVHNGTDWVPAQPRRSDPPGSTKILAPSQAFGPMLTVAETIPCLWTG